MRKNYDRKAAAAAAELCWIDCSGDVNPTSQSAAQDCDVNVVLRKYGITHDVSEDRAMQLIGTLQGVRGEFGLVVPELSYHQALTQLRNAEAAFMDLPAPMRAKFGNDPMRMLDALAAADAGNAAARAVLEDAGVTKAVLDAPASPAVPAPAAAAPAAGTAAPPAS